MQSIYTDKQRSGVFESSWWFKFWFGKQFWLQKFRLQKPKVLVTETKSFGYRNKSFSWETFSIAELLIWRKFNMAEI